MQKTFDCLSFATLMYLFAFLGECSVKSFEYQKVRNQSVAIGYVAALPYSGEKTLYTYIILYITTATSNCHLLLAGVQKKPE